MDSLEKSGIFPIFEEENDRIKDYIWLKNK